MNDVMIIGELTYPEFDHEVNGDRIYKAQIRTQRLSSVIDTVPLLIPEYLCNNVPARARIFGEFRSHNTEDGHLQLYVYVQNIYPAYGILNDEDEIKIEGYICKTAKQRVTPSGRKITDIVVATPRKNILDRSDYLPVVVWGEQEQFNIGEKVFIKGRIQSRKYKEEKIAYEISASELTKQN